MLKRIFIIGCTILAITNVQAQTKKPVAKPTAKPATKPAGTVSATGSINASNYGKVIDYLNGTIDCMNTQGRPISDRQKTMDDMYAFYVTKELKDSYGKPTKFYSPSRIPFDYARDNVSDKCLEATPPSIMTADDKLFYTTNYTALRNAFIKLVKHWNDIDAATDNYVCSYNEEEGKKKAQDYQADLDNYYTIRKQLSTRTKSIQKSLFPYSVAKSPSKKQFINMNDDLSLVQGFLSTFDTYEDMQKNKETLAAALSVIEDASLKHSTELPAENSGLSSNNYKNFYSNINDFVGQTKKVLTATIRDRDIKEEMERIDYYYGHIVDTYNFIMSN